MRGEAAVRVKLIHVPKLEDFYLPFGRYMNVNYMPMGLLGLADHLDRHGHRVEVVHAGLEKIADPAWSVTREVEDPEVAAVGMPLHWHYQSYDVVRAAQKLRAARPDLFLFVGGITASYFGREVLEVCPELDAVVVGEGLEPARLALDALERGETLDGVPNLVHRHHDDHRCRLEPTGQPEPGAVPRIVENRARLLHPQELFDATCYARFDLLRHHEDYVRQFGFPLAYCLELTREENRQRMTMGRSFFPLFVGSGCARSCSFCGGNARTLARINSGHRILWRSHDAVLRDVRRALDAGYLTMALCFDPLPESTAYYVELFRRMRNETPAADLYFECWGLPEQAFVDAFAAAFKPPHSYLALSPDTGNDEVRRRNKGYFYTNAQLLDTCRSLLDRGVQMDIFFTLGLPGETARLAVETRDLIARLAAQFPNIRRLMTWSVLLEPGSPQFEDPERWGIVTSRRTFRDFVDAHREGADAYSALGYAIPGYFDDQDHVVGMNSGHGPIGLAGMNPGPAARRSDKLSVQEFETRFQQFKCMEFCFLSKDPRIYNGAESGREECLRRRTVLALKRGARVPVAAVSAGYTFAAATAAEKPPAPRTDT